MSRSKIIYAAKQVQRCNEKMVTLLESGRAKAQLVSKKRESEQKIREREREMLQGEQGWGLQEGKLLTPERKMAGEKLAEGTQEGSKAWKWT